MGRAGHGSAGRGGWPELGRLRDGLNASGHQLLAAACADPLPAS
jgi:hypothetical protein